MVCEKGGDLQDEEWRFIGRKSLKGGEDYLDSFHQCGDTEKVVLV